MNTFALLFVGLIASSAMSSGGQKVSPGSLPTYLEGTCIHDAQDPFEPNVRMSSGPMKGYCVNPLTRRSAKILSSEEARQYFEMKDGEIAIANFSHKSKFWIARIPVEKANRIILQVEYFPFGPGGVVKIAHTQFRIDFENGATINLVSQSSKDPKEMLSLKRLTFSVENIGPYGEMFDFAKGKKDHYRLAYRFVSQDDKYQWMIAEQKHTVKQFAMNLSPVNVQKFLKRALAESNRYSTTRPYHSIDYNCVTELFVLVDEVMGIKDMPVPFIPNFAPHHFRQRNLLVEKNYPTLNEQYGKIN